MGRIWQDSIKQRPTNGSPQKTWIYWIRTHANYVRAHTIWRHRLAPAASAIAVIYLGFALISHVAFVVIDDAGFVCKDAKRAGRAAPTPLMKQGDKRTVEFNSSALCVPTGIMLEEGSAI